MDPAEMDEIRVVVARVENEGRIWPDPPAVTKMPTDYRSPPYCRLKKNRPKLVKEIVRSTSIQLGKGRVKIAKLHNNLVVMLCGYEVGLNDEKDNAVLTALQLAMVSATAFAKLQFEKNIIHKLIISKYNRNAKKGTKISISADGFDKKKDVFSKAQKAASAAFATANAM